MFRLLTVIFGVSQVVAPEAIEACLDAIEDSVREQASQERHAANARITQAELALAQATAEGRDTTDAMRELEAARQARESLRRSQQPCSVQ